MDIHAIGALGEAFERTKKFFFEPFSIKRWLKLGLVGVLGGITQQAGGNFNCNSPGGGGSGGSGGPSDTDFARQGKEALEKMEHFYKEHNTLIYVLAGLVILLVLALSLIFQYIRANMFFVFMESLIQRDVSIMRSFGTNKGKGFSLFAFRLFLGLTSLIIIVIASIPLILYIWNMAHSANPNWDVWAIVANFMLSIITIFIIAIICHCIMSPTHDFATAIAYRNNTGLIAAWTQLAGLITSNLLQFFMYYVMKVVVTMCLGFVMLLLLIPITLILLIVYLILIAVLAGVGIGIYFIYTFNSVIGIIAGILGILVFIAILIAMGYVFFCPFVPMYAFFRYYPLCFLEKIDITLNFREAFQDDGPLNGADDFSF